MTEDAVDDELTFFEVFDELEYFLTNGRKVPLTSNVIVNEEDILELVDRIRGTMPDEIVKARTIVDDRQSILAATHEEAKLHAKKAKDDAAKVVAEAKDRAEELVNDHVIVTEAKHRASLSVAEAEERARLICDEADRYAATVMGSLEEQLTKTLSTVRKGLDTLPSQKRQKRKILSRDDDDE